MDKEAVFDRLQGARDFSLNTVNPNVTKHCCRLRDTSIPQEYKWWWETKLSRHRAFVKSISLLPGNKLTDLFFLPSHPAGKSLQVPTLEPAMTKKPVFLRTPFGQEAQTRFPKHEPWPVFTSRTNHVLTPKLKWFQWGYCNHWNRWTCSIVSIVTPWKVSHLHAWSQNSLVCQAGSVWDCSLRVGLSS